MEEFIKKYAGICRSPIFMGMCAGLGAIYFKVKIPLYIGHLIDAGVLASDSKQIGVSGFYILLFGIIGSVLWILGKMMFQKAGYQIGKQIRWDLHKNMEQSSILEIEKIGYEAIGRQMTEDTDCVEACIKQYILQTAYVIGTICGSIIVVLQMDRQLGGMFCLVILLLALMIRGILHTTQTKVKEQERSFTRIILALFFPIFLCYCLIQIEHGELTVGSGAAFFLYWYPLKNVEPFAEYLYQKYKESKAAWSRILNTMHPVSQIKEGNIPFSTHSEINTPQVAFEQVTFEKNGVMILNNFNIEVSSGECVAISANKTEADAITYLVARFDEPSSGDVKIDGLSVASYTFQDLRNQIGIVRKSDKLYMESFYENLLVGNPNASMEELEKALDAVGMLEQVQQRARGIHGMLWKSSAYAMENRLLCIARMLVKEPTILILSQVFEDCDKNEDWIAEKIQKIRTSYPYMTILLIDSNEHNLKAADYIVKLVEGSVNHA